MSCRSWEPHHEGADDDEGAVVVGAFGVAGGDGSELFEPVEAAFDLVALGVEGGIEGGWSAAAGFGGAVGDWSFRSGMVTLMRR